MVLFLITGLVLAGAATALAVRGVALPRIHASNRLRQILSYGFSDEKDAGHDWRRELAFERVASLVGRAVSSRVKGFNEAELRTELMSAGIYTLSPAAFFGYRVMSGVGMPFLFLWLTTSAGSAGSIVAMAVVIGALGGWVGPITFVRRKARRRLERIERALPELVDLLVVTVEAGLGLNSSMKLAAGRVSGPLGDELRLTLQEQRMGLATTEALSNMMGRCETPSVRSFVRSILQGETLGVSIGQIMRSLAREMRVRRRQNAEERAQKAPVKILFPLVFFIFPPMFVVILFPAVHRFLESFGGA